MQNYFSWSIFHENAEVLKFSLSPHAWSILLSLVCFSFKRASGLQLASLDPYNTTEHMHWDWKSVSLDWTNGNFLYKVRAAEVDSLPILFIC